MEGARQVRAQHRGPYAVPGAPRDRRRGRGVLGIGLRHRRDPAPQLREEQHRHRTGHGQQQETRPVDAGHRQGAGDEQRSGEGAHLVERLVHREPAAPPGLHGHPGEQGRLRRAADRLAGALEQDQRRRHGDPGHPTNGATASSGTHTAVIA